MAKEVAYTAVLSLLNANCPPREPKSARNPPQAKSRHAASIKPERRRSATRAIGSDTTRDFATPNRVGKLVRRRRRVGVREMRITKTTDAKPWWEYRATLQACCIHRWFCAADASTPVWSESDRRISQGEKVNGENRGG